MAQHIRVVDYRPEWAAQFQEEADRLRGIIGDNLIEIHHIGSTAVPGLKAKPILDIMPVVKALEPMDCLNREFEALGYECMGEFGIPGRRYYRKGGDDRTHQIHLFSIQSREEIRRHLALRDYLRTHPQAAAAYGELKHRLTARFPEDIEGYCDGKDPFVQSLEQVALHWYHRRLAENGAE